MVYNGGVDALLEGVDLGGRELARRHAPLEESVQLGECAAGGLGHAEVRVDDAAEADATLWGYVS